MAKCKYEGCNENAFYDENPEYCIFHMDKSDGNSDIESEFKDQFTSKINRIERNDELEHNYEGYIFPPNFEYFQSATYKKPYNLKNSIFLNSSEDKNFILFIQGEYKDSIDFTGATFYCDVDCEAKFHKNVIFINNKFCENVNFIKNHFLGYVDFHKSIFYKETKFDHIGFNDGVCFNDVEFRGKVEFTGVYFGNDNNNYSSEKEIAFINSKFLNETTFRRVWFCMNTSFQGSEFRGHSTLFEIISIYCKIFNFSNTILKSKYSYFKEFSDRNKEDSNIFFNNSKSESIDTIFSKWQMINLVTLDFSNITIHSDQINFFKFNSGKSKLDFTNAEFYGIKISFKENTFQNRLVEFANSKFLCKEIDFSNTKFIETEVNFFKSQFGNLLDDPEKVNTEGSLINFEKVECDCEISFNEAKFYGRYLNFEESKFTKRTNFKGTEFGISNAFLKDINFSKSEFFGEHTDFSEAKFYSKKIDFKEAKFKCKKGIDLDKTIFGCINNQSDELNFIESNFNGKYLNFKETQFYCKLISFRNTNFELPVGFEKVQIGTKEFNNEKLDFSFAEFHERFEFSKNSHINSSKIYFSNATTFKIFRFSEVTIGNHDIKNKLLSFIDTKFINLTSFYKCTFFSEALKFKRSEFENGFHMDQNGLIGNIYFEDIILSEKSNFYIENMKFFVKIGNSKPSSLGFKNVNFIPIKTKFLNIKPTSKEEKTFPVWKFIINEYPYIYFRNCNLNDVIFDSCFLSIFSFYKSYFDSARFISCEWGGIEDKNLFFTSHRINILFEEFILTQFSQTSTKELQDEIIQFVTDLDLTQINYDDISKMYRRMKTASDNIKDYFNAGDFYFNEYEMRKTHFYHTYYRQYKTLHVFKKISSRLNFIFKYPILRNLISGIPLSIYKYVAGYGERPLRSFIWFTIFLFTFGCFHLLNGSASTDYNINISWKGLSNIFTSVLLNDLVSNTLYASTKILFRSYENLIGKPWEFLLSFVNSITLILMLTFFINGIRRKFKRY